MRSVFMVSVGLQTTPVVGATRLEAVQRAISLGLPNSAIRFGWFADEVSLEGDSKAMELINQLGNDVAPAGGPRNADIG